MRVEIARRAVAAAAIVVLGISVSLMARPANAQAVLITGANSGIGLEFAKQYAAKGWTVAGVYNDRAECPPGEEACPGDWSTQTFGNLRYGLFDTIMAVNVKGALLVSEAFVEHVKASSQKKIVSISSTNGSLTEQLSGSGAIFYRASKASLNRAMQLVASATRGDDVTVLLLNPGPVLTERQAYVSEFEGMLELPYRVGHMIETIERATIADTGRFLHYDGTTAPW